MNHIVVWGLSLRDAPVPPGQETFANLHQQQVCNWLVSCHVKATTQQEHADALPAEVESKARKKKTRQVQPMLDSSAQLMAVLLQLTRLPWTTSICTLHQRNSGKWEWFDTSTVAALLVSR